MRRGQAARELLNNPLLREALDAVRADLNSQIATVSLTDIPAHTRLVTAVQVTRAVERHLVGLIELGEAMAEQISLQGKRID